MNRIKTRQRFIWVPLVVSVVVLLSLPGVGLAEGFLTTIRGKVVYPDGSPAAGIELMLYPWGGGALDRSNVVWKIPNFDNHPVTTDRNGEFVMSNVIDYPENRGHRYVVFAVGPTRFYHATAHVILGRVPDFSISIKLEKATALRLELKNPDGKPFNGTRAVYVQSGVLGQGVMKGISYVTEVKFVNGVGEIGPVVLKDQVSFKGRVAVLGFPNQLYAKAAMKERGIPLGDTDQPLRWVAKDARGRALDRSVQFVPAGVTELAFSL